MRPVIVTGANGYLGEWVCHYLFRAGRPVVRFNTAQNYDELISDRAPLSDLVHLGWYARAGDGDEQGQNYSIVQTLRLMKKIRTFNRVVFASTVSVYGDGENFTEDSRLNPGCWYTKAKVSGEEVVKKATYNQCFIIRMASLMGLGFDKKRTRTDLVANSFASQAWLNKKIEVWNPDAVKPVVHVQDAAQIITDCVTLPNMKPGTINVVQSNWRAIDIAEKVAREIDRTCGKMPYIEVVEDTGGRGSRSASVSCLRLERPLRRSIEDVAQEFREYFPKPWDKTMTFAERRQAASLT